MSGVGNDMDRLLAQADWLRGLATYLVRNRDDAEDLVQETFATALRSPPDTSREPRPWLAQVVRNLVRMGARAGARRRTRERASELAEERHVDPADAALERLELQREIAALVVALDEPYRAAVLLRFFEGREPAEIAAGIGVPAGTIRWRISEGVRRLRERLDERHGGGQVWRAALVPLTLTTTKRGGAAATAASGAKWALLAGVAATGAVGGVLWLRAPWPGPQARAPARERLTQQSSSDRSTHSKEEKAMNEAILRKTVVLFGLVLPTLASAGEADKPLPREQAVDTCVWYKEVALQCRNELADFFVAAFAKPDTPPEAKERLRERALKEIVDEGSGPVAPRREKCGKDVDKRPITYGDLATLKKCAARVGDDCKAAVECARAFATRGQTRK
jgi:RNA polymerase sigma-70 factor (ECF subfamily)